MTSRRCVLSIPLVAGLAGHPVEDLDVSSIRVHFDHVRGRLATGVPFALPRDVRGLSGHDSPGLPETRRERVELEELTP